jgi:hypothetical protein
VRVAVFGADIDAHPATVWQTRGVGDDEWDELRARLRQAGVPGAQDLGRFVSNTEFFEPSRFDERAAFEVLLAALPTLNDAKLVGAVAGHLRRPWARGKAFPVLVSAFERWAALDALAAWQLGDALGSVATADDLSQLIALARTSRLGVPRQMIVLALGRFKKSTEAQAAARDLAEDDDVALHALIAYRKIAGPAAALERASEVVRDHPGTASAEQAQRQAKKIAKLLSL